VELIEKYFPGLSPRQQEQFAALEALYADWNEKINVISRKDIDQLYLRHVLHSLAIAKYLSFAPDSQILDVGTGGGFPGIPLAIMFPESNFLLADSIGKKIKVVNAVSEAIGLKNCKGQAIRAESVKQKFDFVVSRAVTAMPVFVDWVKPLFLKKSRNAVPNGILALKGGSLEEELQLPYPTHIMNLADWYQEEFFVTKKLIHLEMNSRP